MKKVVYSVTRVGKYENSKMTGFGFINETDLIALYKGKDGKRHRRVYEDCLRTCYKTNKPNEYKGSFYEIRECEFEKNMYNFSDDEDLPNSDRATDKRCKNN